MSKYRTTAFKGAILSVGMRWTDRFLGLFSTLILARLLAPADFGLVSMAMIVVGLIDVLLDLGVGSALIQNSSADKQDFDTAWTLRLGQAALAATILVAGAPLAAGYYKDARVVDIMRVIAITVMIGGFENIGVVMFWKGMEFGRDFRFFFSKRVLTTAFTITAALLLKSYWALVLGSLFGRLTGVALSYAFHPYRPALSLVKLRQIWAFSQWNMVMSLVSYLNSRLDKFVIGRRESAAVLGAYSVGDEMASMPTTELLAPLGRVMYPAFVEARSNRTEFMRLVLLAFSVQTLVGIPAGVGVALVAPKAVPVLLGTRWQFAVPFVQVLGFVEVASSLIHSSQYMLLSLGRIRTLAIYFTIQFGLLLSLLVVVFPTAGAMVVAQARLGVAAVGLLVMLVLAGQAVPELRYRSFLRSAWRPVTATLVMAAAVSLTASQFGGSSHFVALLAEVAVGVGTYGIVIALLWGLSGRPEGAETYILRSARLA